MSKRPPAAPPQLPGFEYIQLLGSGGFADVFLYEQQLPKRRVAVKVLLPDRLESAGQQFASEANVMAMLSNHPAIVTILQAGMSADQRPYIVMEHCPRPNLQLRYRRAPFSVAESLHIAIPVIAAVETAHRMGVLHRDIKPANILVTEYNRPALTDFGIASHAETAEAAAGMSIPWSPPESFENPPRNGRATDVYQLGATLYTLLAGRAPFEIPGQRNTSAELIDRAERMPLQRLDRPDVPLSLQNALSRAMAKQPEDRFPTAVAFARALQKVQIELEHSVTPIDILDDSPTDEIDDDEDGLTRVRNVTSISPEGPLAGGPDDATVVRPVAGATGIDEATTVRGAGRADEATTRLSESPGASATGRGTESAPPPSVRVREPAASSEATLPPPAHLMPPALGAPGAGHAPVGAWAAAPAQQGTDGFGGTVAAAGEPAAAAPRRMAWPWYLGGAAVVAALIAGAAFGMPALRGTDPDTDPGPTTAPKEPVTETPPAVAGLKAVTSGDEVTFTWTNPDPQDGDTYQWGIDRPGSEIDFSDTRDTSVTVPAQSPTCIEVYLVRANGVSSPAATTCAN